MAGIQNIVIALADDLTRARQVTHETQRSVSGYIWAHTNRHLVILRDGDGTENYRCYSLDLATGREVALIEQEGVRSFIWCASRDHPTEMLFGTNARDRQVFDVVRIDITTGTSRVVFENCGYSGLIFDETLTVRLAARVRPDGAAELLEITGDGSEKPFMEAPHEDVFTTAAWRFSRDGRSLFLQDSRGRDTAALIEHDLLTGETRVLAEDAEADIVGAWWDPRTVRPMAALAQPHRQRWHVIDPEVREDLDFLRAQFGDAELGIASQDLLLRRLVIFVARSDAAGEFHLYDRDARTLRLLFKARADLDDVPLRPMLAVTIRARDGLALPSYLTLPHDDFRNARSSCCSMAAPTPATAGATAACTSGWPTAATRFERQLPRLDRFRQGVHRRRRQGGADACRTT